MMRTDAGPACGLSPCRKHFGIKHLISKTRSRENWYVVHGLRVIPFGYNTPLFEGCKCFYIPYILLPDEIQIQQCVFHPVSF